MFIAWRAMKNMAFGWSSTLLPQPVRRSVTAGTALSATATAVAAASTTATAATATRAWASEVVAVAGGLTRRREARRGVAGGLLVVKVTAWLAAVAVLGFHARVKAWLCVTDVVTRGPWCARWLGAAWPAVLSVTCVLAWLAGVGGAWTAAEIAATATSRCL